MEAQQIEGRVSDWETSRPEEYRLLDENHEQVGETILENENNVVLPDHVELYTDGELTADEAEDTFEALRKLGVIEESKLGLSSDHMIGPHTRYDVSEYTQEIYDSIEAGLE